VIGTRAAAPAAPARPRSPRGEGERLRAEILAAAEELLLRTGSEDAVSIRAVADAVGVSPPSIYRHFADKSHLLFEVCFRHFERMGAFIESTSEATDDPIEAIRQMAVAYVRFGTENPEHYRIMFMGRSDHTPQQYADEQFPDAGAFGALIALAQRAIDAGQLRPELTDAVTVAHALWAGVHGVVSLAVAKPNMPGPPLDVRAQTLTNALLDGIKRASSRQGFG
jgi:AcrR family transcriptional regulator